MGRRKNVEYVCINGDRLREAINASQYNAKTISMIMGRCGNFVGQSLRNNRIGMDDLEKVCMLIRENAQMFLEDNATIAETDIEEWSDDTVSTPTPATALQADEIIRLLSKIVDALGV